MANQLRWMSTVLHVRLHVPLLDFTSTILTWYTSHCHTSFNSHCSLMRGDPHFIEGKYIKKYPKGSIFHSTSRAPHILWIDILLAQKNTLIIFKPVNLFKKIVFSFPSLKNRMSQKRRNGLYVLYKDADLMTRWAWRAMGDVEVQTCWSEAAGRGPSKGAAERDWERVVLPSPLLYGTGRQWE